MSSGDDGSGDDLTADEISRIRIVVTGVFGILLLSLYSLSLSFFLSLEQ